MYVYEDDVLFCVVFCTGTPPIPVVSLVTPVVKEGDNLVIKCSVSKDKEIHTIEWYKGKKRVTRNVVVMSAFESMLRINNVTKSDAGDYECRVTDFGVGYWHKSASVNVEGKYGALGGIFGNAAMASW